MLHESIPVSTTTHSHPIPYPMPKRSRSVSSASAAGSDYTIASPSKRRVCSIPLQGCTLPLTADNLSQHTSASGSLPELTGESSLSMTSRSGSPTRNAWDTRAVLRAYNVDVDTARALPAELQQHVDETLKHSIDGPRSPNAKRIVQNRLGASLENEST
jgi:hypothetical protein